MPSSFGIELCYCNTHRKRDEEAAFYLKARLLVNNLKKGAGDKKSFLVYRVKLKGGKKVTEKDIWVGAEVIAKVKIVNYNNNTPETDAGGEIVSATGEKPEIKTHVVSVAEALAAAKALADNTTSVDKYTITGYIVSVDANGLYLSDTKGAVAASKDNFLV